MKKKRIIIVVLFIIFVITGCSEKDNQDSNKQEQKQERKQNINTTEIYNKYNNGDISYDEAIDKLNEILMGESKNEIRQNIEKVIDDIKTLKGSKDAYSKGIDSIKKEDYSGAIQQLKEVDEKDTNYKDAEEKLREAENEYLDMVYEQADKFIEEHKYDQAISLYNKAKKVVDVLELDDKISEAEEAKTAYGEEQLLSQEEKAEEYRKAGDYKNALTIYKNLFSKTKADKYEVKIEGIKEEWIDAAIAQSESYLSEGKYSEAEIALYDAKATLGTNTRFTEQEKRIEYYKPLYIATIDPYEKTGWYHAIDETLEGVYGNQYEHSLLGMADDYTNDYKSGYGYISFLINDEYDYLDTSLEYSVKGNPGYNGFLEVYIDDELIYTSSRVSDTEGPENIYVEINRNIHKITFVLRTYDDDCGKIVIGTPKLGRKYTPVE